MLMTAMKQNDRAIRVAARRGPMAVKQLSSIERAEDTLAERAISHDINVPDSADSTIIAP